MAILDPSVCIAVSDVLNHAYGNTKLCRKLARSFFLPSLQDFSGATTTSRANKVLTVPTGIVVQALFRAGLNAGAVMSTLITSLQESDQSPGITALADLSVGSGYQSVSLQRFTDTSAQIGVRSTNTAGTLTIVTYGWIDTRGK